MTTALPKWEPAWVTGLIGRGYFKIEKSALKAQIINVEHHRSHLASAFFASDFEEAAILSIDGFGDYSSTMIATGKGNEIKVLDTVSIKSPNLYSFQLVIVCLLSEP